ncbi:MAG: glutathione S-transferase [Hyphomonas sp.]|uniref:glutathione S-transferase family protein n=1 Tax=Hyphomonas sp. TaxID=87 RepID=UPI001D5C2B9D|nr:glutathione S-transferase [Hyphomonas sp.]MBA4228476.1 glutathione S-transferase [Hyphomonas sp.]
MGGYTLYGAEVSYFTGKARAYLRWRGVDFCEALATQAVYRDVILPKVGWPVIPVMVTPEGEVVQDSADIIETVEAREGLFPPAVPEGPLQHFVAQLLHLYADEWLTLPAMHYRWNYNEDWAYAEFGAISAPQASRGEQYEIGKKNGQRFKGALPILGVHAETIPGIEASYEAFLGEFSAHLERHPFLLGGRPCLADFAFIGPLYAHLYRDPTSGELMRRLAPRVADWVERTHAGERGAGDLMAEDAIPETLEPLLARQMREQFPALVETARLFDAWAGEAAAGAFVPRGLGEIWIDIEDTRGSAQARTFPLYRLQAVTDAYDAMDGAAKARADALLARVRGAPLKDFRLSKRLVRTNYRLALA